MNSHEPNESGINHRAGWLKLGTGIFLIWFLAFVVLPWTRTLPFVAPVMDTIESSDIDVGSYFYTQSEETARAAKHVSDAIRRKQ